MKELLEARPFLRGWRRVREAFEFSKGLGYVGGSYPAYMVSPMPHCWTPNDIDIWAVSDEAADEIVLKFKRKYQVTWIYNGISFTMPAVGNGLAVQVLKPHPDWHDFPMDILESFDLTCSRALLLWDKSVLADPHAGTHVGKIIGCTDAMRTLKRVVKYAQRGVSFDDSELGKLFQAWCVQHEPGTFVRDWEDDEDGEFDENTDEGSDYGYDDYWRGEK